ncbi:MAG: hypothetical protein EA403_00175, partial [Spirochaetaceae bacterium]
TVTVGEPLLEIETDKVSMEVEAEFAGVLLKILKGPGEVVPVTETIGYIGEAGESVPKEGAAAPISAPAGAAREPSEAATPTSESRPSATASAAAASTSGPAATSPTGSDGNGRVPATPAARRLADEHGVALSQLSGSGEYGAVRVADVRVAAEAGGTQVKASSLARRVAAEANVDLAAVAGSGPQGRVTRGDVLAAAAAAGERAGSGLPAPPDERRAIAGMRKVIADNMMKSHLGIPPVTLNASAEVSRLLALRTELNDGADQRGDVKISLNDLVMKAVAAALADHRDLNATVDGSDVVLHGEINLGMAVALPDGLIVPVIHRVDTLPVGRLARRTRDLATRARDRKLQPAELEGATFTVTNLGMLGIESFNPIINPPQVAILGVCAVSEVPAVENGSLVVRRRMGLSLTIDHRVVDGAQGAHFLQTLVGLLEHPARVLR